MRQVIIFILIGLIVFLVREINLLNSKINDLSIELYRFEYKVDIRLNDLESQKLYLYFKDTEERWNKKK